MTSSKNYILSISIIGVLFFMFGYVTWQNGALIPFFKLACELKSNSEALLVTFAFYIAYFFLSIPSSFILNKTGYKRGMSIGLVIMAIGALLFLPAAQKRDFNFFLTGLFIQAAGMALLQTACNPYISVIGPIESATKRMSIMGIFNKAAGVLSPVILSAIVLKGASGFQAKVTNATDEVMRNQLLQELSNRVMTPYIIMAVVLLTLAVMIWFSPLPEIESNSSDASDNSQSNMKNSIFQFPHLLLGSLCIFLYVGAEVMAGDVIGLYGQSMGMSLDETKTFTSYTLISMVVGYVIGIVIIPKYLKQDMALRICALLGIVFVTLAFFTHGYASIFFIAMLGLANSLMWPAIFPLAIEGLGRFTKIGSAFLVMGIVGGAALPQVYARLAESMHFQTAFFYCVLPCYLYILFYAMKGHNVGKAVAK
jgi:FHS family L-fucose permease-like MFS transporter